MDTHAWAGECINRKVEPATNTMIDTARWWLPGRVAGPQQISREGLATRAWQRRSEISASASEPPACAVPAGAYGPQLARAGANKV
jgi:hypothetical protein